MARETPVTAGCVTGDLPPRAVVRLYRYVSSYTGGVPGMARRVPYGAMAYRLELPYAFADRDNAPWNATTLDMLRGALRRLERLGLLRVEGKGTRDAVPVRLIVAPAELSRRYGRGALLRALTGKR